MGLKRVYFVITTRFYEMKEFEVHDNDGNIEYTIAPAQTDRFKRTPNNTLHALVNTEVRNSAIESAIIEPKCITDKGIYVDPYGNIFPCCWLGGDYLEQPVEETLPIHFLRNLSVENTKSILKTVGVPNCHNGVLDSNENLFEKLPDFWQGKDKCMTCVKTCSKALYDSRK